MQGYLAHKKLPPPLGPPYDPWLSLTEGPRRMVFLMIEAPLYLRIQIEGKDSIPVQMVFPLVF